MRLISRRRRGPRVSVVMASFNGERYLDDQLSSIAAQTTLPDELVVRDDGSADRTVEQLRSFARVAPFDVLITAGERLGYAQNFVACAAGCTGELLVFADQDDVWHAGKIARLVAAAAAAPPEAAIFHDLSLRTTDPAAAADSYFARLRQHALPAAVSFKGCSMTVTRSFVQAWGWPPPESSVSHDFWVAFWATAFGQRIDVADALVEHRLHEHNTSGWIAAAADRVWSGPSSSDLDTLVDLVIKRWRVDEWTRVLLAALERRRGHVNPALAEEVRRSLTNNSERYAAAV